MIAFCSLMGCHHNQEEEVDKSKLLGNDYRLFRGTPAWPLAKAVESGDTSLIRKEVKEHKINPDYQESQFGKTLLMVSTINSNYNSVKALLELGADPNLKDKYKGSSAMTDAAGNDDPKYLKLLLTYKGDPSSLEDAPVKEGDLVRETTLNKAISPLDENGLQKVKLLVEAGADINYSNEGKPAYTRLPIADALTADKMDVVLYLLKNGADYKRGMYKAVDNQEVYILEALRNNILDLNSTAYQKKLEVISFLKSKGLDYYKQPIPDYILKKIKKKYPENWEEYARKY